MTELERELASLQPLLAFPDAEIRRVVWQGIAARRAQRRRRTAFVLAFAVIVVAFTPALLLRGARDGILRALGIDDTSTGVVVRPTTVPVTLRDGSRSTLTAAAARVRFEPVLPASLPRPTDVFVGNSLAGGAVTLLFDVGGRRFRLREFRGTSVDAAGARVSVHGQPGVWLGKTKDFTYRDPTGKTRLVHLDTSGNTLVWQRGPLTLQLESIAMTQSYALALARTVV